MRVRLLLRILPRRVLSAVGVEARISQAVTDPTPKSCASSTSASNFRQSKTLEQVTSATAGRLKSIHHFPNYEAREGAESGLFSCLIVRKSGGRSEIGETLVVWF
jgi:hypothetical protein